MYRSALPFLWEGDNYLITIQVRKLSIRLYIYICICMFVCFCIYICMSAYIYIVE